LKYEWKFQPLTFSQGMPITAALTDISAAIGRASILCCKKATSAIISPLHAAANGPDPADPPIFNKL
jgi:hypothetical protein